DRHPLPRDPGRGAVQVQHVHAPDGAGMRRPRGRALGIDSRECLRALPEAPPRSGGRVNGSALESRLGELMIVGIPGTDLPPDVDAALRRVRPSGAILFAENLTDADQAARLARAIQETIGTPELPALVSADEEGGMVSQLSGFWEVPPSARAVASS